MKQVTERFEVDLWDGEGAMPRDRLLERIAGKVGAITLLTDQDVMLTLNGQMGFALKADDTVEVRQAAARTRLLRFPQKHFFSVLRTKLKWGER